MCPNIKELDLSWCENLVEIENSVGRLDRLHVGDFHGVKFSLRTTIPWSFGPLRYHICQNLSFGNLTGLRELFIESFEGLLHLPRSIYNLQHIEKLELDGYLIFPRDVEIDRQPPCNSLGGFSKYVFPSLKNLTLLNFSNPLEIDFILNYCCPVTLERLDISGCGVITLPESTSRYERLLWLRILTGEIPRLPRSLRYLAVSKNWLTPLSLKSVFHWVSLLNLKLIYKQFLLPSKYYMT